MASHVSELCGISDLFFFFANLFSYDNTRIYGRGLDRLTLAIDFLLVPVQAILSCINSHAHCQIYIYNHTVDD